MKGLTKIFKLAPLVLLLLAGYKGINSLLELVDKNNYAHENVESGLTPEQVLKLYLTYTGTGKYVMAYELLNDKQKQEQTISNLEQYGKIGKTELQKVLNVQQKDDVSLVAAAVKHTDDKTQVTKYEIEEFILTKDSNNEWRLIDQERLGNEQTGILKNLLVKQANVINNSQVIKESITWMNQENKKLIKTSTDETKISIDAVKGSFDGVNNITQNLKEGLFSE
jgi:hypothetical protein